MGTVTATPGGSYNYFGLYWGSMDDYNTLTFYSGSNAILSITGADVITALNLLGNQTAAGSNRYVDFYFGSLSFDSFKFSSTTLRLRIRQPCLSAGCRNRASSASRPRPAGPCFTARRRLH